MRNSVIHQLLHGYRQGHEQIAGSIVLEPQDRDLVARLSDLSGTMAGAPQFESYLTAYPLSNARYYALARTWLDQGAPRAGCVLTHTLLIPIDVWSRVTDPRVFEKHLRFPLARKTGGYMEPMEVDLNGSPPVGPLLEGRVSDLETFIRKYFADGRRPVVWFDQYDSETHFWTVLRACWPRLRAKVSACSMCLQPRTVQEGYFEIMFAPHEVSARFSKFDEPNFVPSSSDSGKTDIRVDRWPAAWARALVHNSSTSVRPEIHPLWDQLDEDPTSVRRVFFLLELLETEAPTPEALVGALDLIESLSKGASSSIELKKQAATRAIQVSEASANTTLGLECLGLIEDRLMRSSYQGIGEDVGSTLMAATERVVVRSPSETAKYLSNTFDKLHIGDSWFGRGVVSGVSTLATMNPRSLALFGLTEGIIDYLLAREASLALTLVKATYDFADDSARGPLRSWVRSQVSAVAIGIARKAILPTIRLEDLDLLPILLQGTEEQEIYGIFEAIWSVSARKPGQFVLDLVVLLLAQPFPQRTQAWLANLSTWSEVEAQVFSGTFQKSVVGLRSLTSSKVSPNEASQAFAIAAFLASFGKRGYPSWLREAAQENADILLQLLPQVQQEAPYVTSQIAALLGEMSFLPTERLNVLLERISNYRDAPYLSGLVRLAMRTLISQVVSIDRQDSSLTWLFEDPRARNWFREVEQTELRSLLFGAGQLSPAGVSRIWIWIADAPEPLYERSQESLLELTGVLLRSSISCWTVGVSECLVKVLSRTRRQQKRLHVSLCGQALKFSFLHTSLPLGPVVVASFGAVYGEMLEPTPTIQSFLDIFNFFDWDKAKELRAELVTSFLNSRWAPGDLFRAAGEAGLTRKVFRRLFRTTGGPDFARRALVDLEARSDSDPNLVRTLRTLVANPYFPEDWD